MSHRRSIFAGMTDYTGVDLDTIVEHLKEWKENTDKTIKSLEGYIVLVRENWDRLDGPGDIESYLRFFIDLFKRYSVDFTRLINELPFNIEKRHVDILEQIYESSKLEEKQCVSFKHDHIVRSLKDESLRYSLIDKIYEDTRNMIIDYKDLSKFAYRLKTFVGTKRKELETPLAGIDALELKPNIFGIGINLNHLIKRFFRIYKSK